MCKFLRLNLFLLVFALSGCLEESQGLQQVSIPNVSISCDQDQVSQCNSSFGAGKTLYLGLLSTSFVNCEEYLDQIPSGDFSSFFDFSGTAVVTFSGTALIATVTSWVDNNGFSVTTMGDTLHQVCAFIDTSIDGRVSSGEPAGDGEFTPSDPSTVTMWFNY